MAGNLLGFQTDVELNTVQLTEWILSLTKAVKQRGILVGNKPDKTKPSGNGESQI